MTPDIFNGMTFSNQTCTRIQQSCFFVHPLPHHRVSADTSRSRLYVWRRFYFFFFFLPNFFLFLSVITLYTCTFYFSGVFEDERFSHSRCVSAPGMRRRHNTNRTRLLLDTNNTGRTRTAFCDYIKCIRIYIYYVCVYIVYIYIYIIPHRAVRIQFSWWWKRSMIDRSNNIMYRNRKRKISEKIRPRTIIRTESAAATYCSIAVNPLVRI
jgi:hypothetical protein